MTSTHSDVMRTHVNVSGCCKGTTNTQVLQYTHAKVDENATHGACYNKTPATGIDHAEYACRYKKQA